MSYPLQRPVDFADQPAFFCFRSQVSNFFTEEHKDNKGLGLIELSCRLPTILSVSDVRLQVSGGPDRIAGLGHGFPGAYSAIP